MHPPSITAAYLAVLALIYAALGLQVVRLRRRTRAGFGDGGSEELRSAIRAHAHFAEHVPLIALMSALLELLGAAPAQVHGLMGMLLAARLVHPVGMYAKPQTLPFAVGRVGGMLMTTAVMVTCAALILRRALSGE